MERQGEEEAAGVEEDEEKLRHAVSCRMRRMRTLASTMGCLSAHPIQRNKSTPNLAKMEPSGFLFLVPPTHV